MNKIYKLLILLIYNSSLFIGFRFYCLTLGHYALTFNTNIPNVFNFSTIILSSLVGLYSINNENKTPSSNGYSLLYLIWFAPSIVISSHAGNDPINIKFINLVEILLSYVCIPFFYKIIRTIIKNIKPVLNIKKFNFLLGIFIFISLLFALQTALVFKGGSFSFINEALYERRLLAREISVNPLVGYIMSWLASLGPIIIFYYYSISKTKTSKIFQVFLLFFLSAIFFYLYGQKSTPLILIFGILFFIKKEKLISLKSFLFTKIISIIIFSSIILFKIFPSPLSVGLLILIRRAILDTGFTSGAYLSYFTKNDLYFFSDSSLYGIFSTPLEDKSFRIGETFGSGPLENWNGSAFAEAYGDLGFLGMISISILISIFFIVLDRSQKKLGFIFPNLISFYLIFLICQTAITSVFISYGIAPLFLLLLLSG